MTPAERREAIAAFILSRLQQLTTDPKALAAFIKKAGK